MLSRFIELAGSGGRGGRSAVNMPDSIGWTPLFWACNNGHGEEDLRAFRALVVRSFIVLCMACSSVADPT